MKLSSLCHGVTDGWSPTASVEGESGLNSTCGHKGGVRKWAKIYQVGLIMQNCLMHLWSVSFFFLKID